MIVYPAIDIRGGHAVQLRQGDYSAESRFDSDPADAARRWAAAGAEWIHVVDLDAAKDGTRANARAIAAIRAATDLPIELGGGLRSLADIEAARDLGIDRLILGSVAVSRPELVEEAVQRYGDAIAVGLDARNGKLATNGWLNQSEVSALDAARRFSTAGVRHVIFTDIHRDGTLTGPNLASLGEMATAVAAGVIASGGIGTLDDVRAVARLGVAGVIIGSALYHGRIRLEDALAIAREEVPQ